MKVQVWRDESERWERTGRLDQGPCWCDDCVKPDLDSPISGTGDDRG